MNINEDNFYYNNIKNNNLKNQKNSMMSDSHNSIELFNNKSSKVINNNNNDEEKNKMDYNDDELNILSYELAKLYDKRTYWQYYISLIKSKHIFIFSFFVMIIFQN